MDKSRNSFQNAIYIIDKKYKILHFNQAFHELFPSVECGDTCYKSLTDSNVPCAACALSSENLNNSALFYHSEGNTWMTLHTSEIDWPGAGPCMLAMLTEVSNEAADPGNKVISSLHLCSSHARDPMTGLYNRDSFFYAVEKLFRTKSKSLYCMIAIDIEHFKLFNEWYGEKAGDEFLMRISKYIKKAANDNNGIVGRIGGDDFAVVLPNIPGLLTKLQDEIVAYVKQYSGNAGFLPAFGIYAVEEKTISASGMYDRAAIALSSAKGTYAGRVCWYDSGMKQQLEGQHKLLAEIQQGIQNGEFTFFAQPKCNMITGKIIGLEALVRWNHPERGLIPPDQFIPFLENNGFITTLDIYLWDKVCQRVKSFQDAGHTPVPVSVNVSRADIFTLDVVGHFCTLLEKYQLPPKLIEIEITESAYAENVEVVADVVKRLRAAGFKVLMDDFGSGYSSLNMLKDVNVDTLKIDMRFLRLNGENPEKGEEILETIVRMARLMELEIIAEGVETKEQLDFLLDVGCFYAQGYYFYRPLPIPELEAVLADTNRIDYRSGKAKQLNHLRFRDIFAGDMFSEALLNNILGGIAFYDVYNGHVELTQVNEQYYRITGANPLDLEQQRRTIMDMICPQDHPAVLRIFTEARQHVTRGAWGEVRRLKDDGATIWLQLRAFFIREYNGHCLYYGCVSDVTQRKLHEQQLEAAQKSLAELLSLPETDTAAITSKKTEAVISLFAPLTPGAYNCRFFTASCEFAFISDTLLDLLGFTPADIEEQFANSFLNMVHPEDSQRVQSWMGSLPESRIPAPIQYRIMSRRGYLWVADQGKSMTYEGTTYILSVLLDITEKLEIQTHTDIVLRHVPDCLILVHYSRGDFSFRILCQGVFQDFAPCINKQGWINNRHFFQDLVHPDDYRHLREQFPLARNQQKDIQEVVRLHSPDGGLYWVEMHFRFIDSEKEKLMYLCTCRNITSLKEKERELSFTNRKMESILSHAGINSWDWDFGHDTLTVTSIGMPFPPVSYGNYLAQDNHIALRSFPDSLINSYVLPSKYRQVVEDFIRQLRFDVTGTAIKSEIPLLLSKGSLVWLEVEGETLLDEEGHPVRAVGYLRDITQIKRHSHRLRQHFLIQEALKNQALYDFHVNLTRDMLVSGKSRSSWRKDSGFRGGHSFYEAVEYLCENTLLPPYREKFREFFSRDRLMRLLNEEMASDSIDYQRIYQGEPRWMRLIVYLTQFDDTPDVFAYLFVIDIDKEMTQKLRLTRLAELDSLTGLYNRQAAIPKIKQYLASMEDEHAALVMLDLDNFKSANDVFGHSYGDELINATAARLKSSFRGYDIICRIGGDEFLVLCKNIRQEDMEKKLTSLTESMILSHKNSSREFIFSISAGYVMVPEQGTDFDDLYRKADIALFASKLKGKHSCTQYSPELKSVRYELSRHNQPH